MSAALHSLGRQLHGKRAREYNGPTYTLAKKHSQMHGLGKLNATAKNLDYFQNRTNGFENVATR